VSINTPVHEAVDLLAQRRIGALPVMDGHAIAGIFPNATSFNNSRTTAPPCSTSWSVRS
jgi:predicted transcriptional regulator